MTQEPVTQEVEQEIPADVPIRPENPDPYTLKLEEAITHLQGELEASPGAEARGIAWCDVYGKAKDPDGNLHVVCINLTQRSDIGAQEALENMLDTLRFARTRKLFPWPPDGVSINARGNVRQDELPVSAPAKAPAVSPVSAPTPTPSTAPVQPATELVSGTLTCVRLNVTPVVGGKVSLKFYGNDRKQPINEFPTLTNTLTVEKAIEMFAPLGPWEAAHFAAASNYDVKFYVEWKQGRDVPNKPGKHYQDIIGLRPA